MDRKSLITGILFIGIGVLLLADNLDFIRVEWQYFFEDFFQLWPVLMMAGGAGFWLNWLRNRENVGQLLPGTILLTYGSLFLYLSLTGEWWQMGEYNLWSLFIAGPGLGFLAMYLFGKQDRGQLVTAGILLAISALFFAGVNNFRLIWPVILIIIGIRLIFKNRRDDNQIPTAHEQNR